MPDKFKVVHTLPHHLLSHTLLRIVDLLYYDEDEQVYDPQKEWDQETIEEVDRCVTQAGLRPNKTYPAEFQNLPSKPQPVRFMVVFDGYHPTIIDEKVPPSFVSNDDRVEWFRVHRFTSAAYRKKHRIDQAGPCWITTTAISGLTGSARSVIGDHR